MSSADSLDLLMLLLDFLCIGLRVRVQPRLAILQSLRNGNLDEQLPATQEKQQPSVTTTIAITQSESNSHRLIASSAPKCGSRNVQNGLLLIGVHLFAEALVVPRAFGGRSHRMDVAVEGVPRRTAWWQRGTWSSTWSWWIILASSMAVMTKSYIYIYLLFIYYFIYSLIYLFIYLYIDLFIYLFIIYTISKNLRLPAIAVIIFTSICSDTKHVEQTNHSNATTQGVAQIQITAFPGLPGSHHTSNHPTDLSVRSCGFHYPIRQGHGSLSKNRTRVTSTAFNCLFMYYIVLPSFYK